MTRGVEYRIQMSPHLALIALLMFQSERRATPVLTLSPLWVRPKYAAAHATIIVALGSYTVKRKKERRKKKIGHAPMIPRVPCISIQYLRAIFNNTPCCSMGGQISDGPWSERTTRGAKYFLVSFEALCPSDSRRRRRRWQRRLVKADNLSVPIKSL